MATVLTVDLRHQLMEFLQEIISFSVDHVNAGYDMDHVKISPRIFEIVKNYLRI